MLRVLVIAEAANPEWVSVPLIGYSLFQAISSQTHTHLVTQIRNRGALVRAGLVEGRDFTAIDSERLAAPLYRASSFIRGGEGVGWTTLAAVAPISYYYFEWLVWKHFRGAIRDHKFDLVHRITPLSPTTPSTLAKRCARAGTPFILGPLNGGVSWPKEFESARRKEREWFSYVRGAYKFFPGYRSTLQYSAVIVAGSRSTMKEIPARFQSKCIFLPENAVDPTRFCAAPFSEDHMPKTLRACFVGRLVPYKGPDMLLEAVAPLIREGRLFLDIMGQGPLLPMLTEFVERQNLRSGVALHGWIEHAKLQPLLSKCQLLLFPSIREFGGGVILEAMAMGIVPVVVNYGGPGELVSDSVGFKIPIGSRRSIVQELRNTVTAICDHPRLLSSKSKAALSYSRHLFTWSAKAQQIMQIYRWVLDPSSPKPDFFNVGETPEQF